MPPGYAPGQSYNCTAYASNVLGEGAGSSPVFPYTTPPGAPIIALVNTDATLKLYAHVTPPTPNGDTGETCLYAQAGLPCNYGAGLGLSWRLRTLHSACWSLWIALPPCASLTHALAANPCNLLCSDHQLHHRGHPRWRRNR